MLVINIYSYIKKVLRKNYKDTSLLPISTSHTTSGCGLIAVALFLPRQIRRKKRTGERTGFTNVWCIYTVRTYEQDSVDRHTLWTLLRNYIPI